MILYFVNGSDKELIDTYLNDVDSGLFATKYCKTVLYNRGLGFERIRGLMNSMVDFSDTIVYSNDENLLNNKKFYDKDMRKWNIFLLCKDNKEEKKRVWKDIDSCSGGFSLENRHNVRKIFENGGLEFEI